MSTASENPSTAALPFHRRPWFITLLVLSLLFLLLLWLLPVGIGYGIKSWLTEHGAEQAQVEDVDFNPFTGALAVRGVQASASGRPVMQLPLLTVVMDWMPLWQKRAYIRSLELQGLRLSVEEVDEGAMRIGGVRLPAGPDDESPEKPEQQATWGYGIAQLRISDSEVDYQGSRLTTQVALRQLELSQLRSWEPELAADLSLSAAIGQAPLEIKGQLTPFSANPAFDGQVSLQALLLETFAGLAAPQLQQLAGILSMDTSLRAQQQEGTLQLQQQGAVEIEALQFAQEHLQLKQERVVWDGGLQMQIAGSEPEIRLDLEGRLEQGPMDLNLGEPALRIRDQGFSWQGGLSLVQRAESDSLGLKGVFEHKALDLALPGNEADVKNGRLHWSGELRLERSDPSIGVESTGELKLNGFQFNSAKQASKVTAERIDLSSAQLIFSQKAASGTVDLSHKGKLSIAEIGVIRKDERLTEQALHWQGNLNLVSSAEKLQLDVEGEARTEALALALSTRDLDLEQGPMHWSGAAGYLQSAGEPEVRIAGDITAGALHLDAPKHNYRLLAFDSLRLEGINLQALNELQLQRVSTSNIRLARRQDVQTAEEEEAPALLRAARSNLNGVSFATPVGLHIEQLEHENLHSIIRRDKEGGLNAVGIIDVLTAILANEAQSDQAGDLPAEQADTATAETATTAEPGGLPVRVDKVVITGESSLLYSDNHVDPQYLARLDFSEFQISHIDSSKPEQESPFSVKAKIGAHAQLNLDGKVRFFDKKGTADIKGRIEALELPPLSAYAGPAIGYKLKSGQLDADIDVKIEQGQISGSNQLAIYQLEVAKLSPEQLKKYGIETTPPLDTGLDMLRDKNNTIKLELPISGDLSQPEFNINDALNQAIGNAMKKGAKVYLAAALFPFGTMLAVAQMAGDAALQVRLDPVVFGEGSVELDKTAREYLEKIKQVIRERPAIHISVCGMAVAGDREFLMQKAEAARKNGEKKDGKTADQQKNTSASTKVGTTPAAVSSAQLVALAAERAARVKGFLLESGEVKASRLVACEAGIDAEKSDAKPRVDLLL